MEIVDRIKALLGMNGTLVRIAAAAPPPEKHSPKCEEGYTYVPAGKFHGMSYLNDAGRQETPGVGYTQAFCISQSKVRKQYNYFQAYNYCSAAGGRLPDEIEWMKVDAFQRQSHISVTPLTVNDQWEWTNTAASGYNMILRGGMITGDFMGDTFAADRIRRHPDEMSTQFRCVLPVQE